MPIASRSKPIVALLLALLASIVLPAGAKATLAFNVDLYRPQVWVSPTDDGTKATYVNLGLVAQVSPDGSLVAYQHGAAFTGWKLMLYDVAAGESLVRLKHMHMIEKNILGASAFAWSPDSTMVAVLQNERRSDKQTLYVIHARGARHKTRIATGYFRGVSFSPDSKEVVFGLAHAREQPAKTDIARAPVSGGQVRLLTRDHISGWPLWGPRGQVAFSKRSRVKRWRWQGEVWTSALFDLFVMNANGGRVKRLTGVRSYDAGFFAAFWLPSGKRLVANFESLDKNYAALVDPRSGAVKPLNPPASGAGLGVGEAGFAAVSLTADEQTVLGCFGSVVYAGRAPASVPIAGGEPAVLNQDRYSPSWSGLPTAGAGAC